MMNTLSLPFNRVLKTVYPTKIIVLFFLYIAIPVSAIAQTALKVSEHGQKKDFPLIETGHAASIYVDQNDFPVAGISAGLFAEDVNRVTGKMPALYHVLSGIKGNIIIIGTIGKCRVLDHLIAQHKIDVSKIQNKWESYLITTINNPMPGIKNALIIAGSDRRGTSFGVFSVSEAIGVSPWYWWADVAPFKHKQLYIKAGNYLQPPPSIKYRGIFINDERFGGLAIWAAKTFDPQTGNIGPKTYQKVFELLLRLKANYLWPAMHPGTRAFNSFSENAKMADDYAIVMGSSHCEQMLRDNEAEWKAVGTFGPFDYGINRGQMNAYWEERVKTNAQYENIWTIGLRGVHDSQMEGAKTLGERISYCQAAIGAQREMLAKYVNPDLPKVPQVLCAYKEVLAIYQNGLKLPEDVTLMWADDNHGFIRQLSNEKEQLRAGGSGVYYHLSYHGDPESWIWLSSISPKLIAYEMGKAYQYNADKIWIFNVGDIKPAEKEISFAMKMAWNADKYTPMNANQYIRQWCAQTFGSTTADKTASIMNEYYRLASTGKPEHVVWNDFSELEIEHRIKNYRDIRKKAIAIAKLTPKRLKDAYYELILYPVMGAGLMNEYFLYAKRSLIRAAAGDTRAMEDVKRSKMAYTELNQITEKYNHEIASGKWGHLLNWRPYKKLGSTIYDLDTATLEKIEEGKKAIAPVVVDLNQGKYSGMITLQNNAIINTGSGRQTQQTGGSALFNWNASKDGKVSLWFKSTTPIIKRSFKPEENAFWYVKMNNSLVTGAVIPIGNIWHAIAIGPIWNKIGDFWVHKGSNKLWIAQRDSGAIINKIFIGAQPPLQPAFKQTIDAGSFVKKQDSGMAKIETISGLGEGKQVFLYPYTSPEFKYSEVAKAPWVMYYIPLKKGLNHLLLKALPTQRIYDGRHVQYAVSINDEKPVVMDLQSDEFSPEWQQNVLRGYNQRIIDYKAQKTGVANLKIYLMDPGVVIQNINLY